LGAAADISPKKVDKITVPVKLILLPNLSPIQPHKIPPTSSPKKVTDEKMLACNGSRSNYLLLQKLKIDENLINSIQKKKKDHASSLISGRSNATKINSMVPAAYPAPHRKSNLIYY